MTQKIDLLLPQWHSTVVRLSNSYKGLIVSCSGGPDSMALLHIFFNIINELDKFAIRVVHFNYQLRGEAADGDAHFVRTFCEKNGISCEVLIAGKDFAPAPESGIQEWAREVRQRYYRRCFDDGWMVLSGHHQDDLAETIVHRLARGSSAAKLLGMHEWQGSVWRPFLNLRKEDLIAYLARQKCPHRHDASNDKMVYTRNIIRHKVIPELERVHAGAGEKIIHLAREVAQMAEFCRGIVRERLESHKYSIPAAYLRELPDALLFMCIEEMVRNTGVAQQMLSRHKLGQLRELIHTTHICRVDIGKNLIFIMENDIAKVEIAPEEPKLVRSQQHLRNLTTNVVGGLMVAEADLSDVVTDSEIDDGADTLRVEQQIIRKKS